MIEVHDDDSLSHFLVTVTLLFPVWSAAFESPFALSFGHNAIQVSRISSTGQVHVWQYQTTSELSVFYENALIGFEDEVGGVDDDVITSMFRNATNPVTDDLARQLGYRPRYAVVMLPSIFDYNIQASAGEAVFPSDHRSKPTKLGSFRTAVCQTYGILQCNGLGRAPNTYNTDGPANILLYLEYEHDFLYAFFDEIVPEFGVCGTITKNICKDCGSKYREVVGAEAYFDRTHAFLRRSIDAFVKERPEGPLNEGLDDVRAIIVAGDAPSSAVDEISAMAQKLIGSQTSKVMEGIEPSEVVAHGASMWAQMIKDKPHTFMARSGNNVDEHDEL